MMIDTTTEGVELALTYSQGKAIINSINLEDGEEKFERICPLAGRMVRLSWWVQSTRTRSRHRPSRESGSSRWRNDRRVTNKEIRHPITDILIDTLVFRAPLAMRITLRTVRRLKLSA